MPYRVLDNEDMAQAAGSVGRSTGYKNMLEYALQNMEDDGWTLVTVEAVSDAPTIWYFYKSDTSQ